MARLGVHGRRWLALVVAIGLVIPAGAWLVNEIGYRRSGAAVVATLEGELAGTDLARTVMLVRSVGCAGSVATGSAFVVATDRGPELVTNAHVVADSRTVGVRTLDGGTDLRVTAVRLSDAADVAVLEVSVPADLPPALTVGDAPLGGDPARLIGFPAATPFTTAGTVAAATPRQLVLDLQVDPGASGSPVVDLDGRVLGQVYGVLPDGRGLATPVALLLDAIATATPADTC